MNVSRLRAADTVSVCFMAAASLLIIASAFVNYESLRREMRVLSYAASALFWIFLLGAWIIKAVLYSKIKKTANPGGKPAIVTFFSNKFAMISDMAALMLLIMLIACLFFKADSTVILILISLFIFAFQMHIALNGKVYKYILTKSEV